jgi:hypothetical protein
MKCARCSGLMVRDHLLDMQESYVPMWMSGLRCVACGNIEDPLIHHHRMVQHTRNARQVTQPFQKPAIRPAVAA